MEISFSEKWKIHIVQKQRKSAYQMQRMIYCEPTRRINHFSIFCSCVLNYKAHLTKGKLTNGLISFQNCSLYLPTHSTANTSPAFFKLLAAFTVICHSDTRFFLEDQIILKDFSFSSSITFLVQQTLAALHVIPYDTSTKQYYFQ